MPPLSAEEFPLLSVEEFDRDFLIQVPMAAGIGIRTLSLGKGHARLFMPYSPALSRPVDTVSGPAMMALADVAVWAAVLTLVGRQEMAVTTNLTMNFLRKAGASDMVADAKIMKMGRRLAVAAVDLLAGDALVAHATATYALP
jgi:uncharacterized protein (TIGR00369 family)